MAVSRADAEKILSLIMDDGTALLELYYGDPWPSMLHESEEQNEGCVYPIQSKSNMGPHDKATPNEQIGTPWPAMLHEETPFLYGLSWKDAIAV